MYRRTILGILLASGLTVAVAAAEMVAVKVTEANIRETPKINRYNLFMQVPQFYPLEVVGKQEAFLQVKDFRGDVGWISDMLVESIRAAVVESPSANLRAGPGTQHSVVLRAEQGVCFRVLEVRGDWAQLEHAGGHRGWMHRSLLWGI